MSEHQKTRRGGVRRTARWAANLAIVAVIAACAAWIVPSAFGYSRYIITGGSMTGTYDKGSVVFEEQVPVADLHVGDVITYMPPAESGVPNLVTHRIVEMQPAQGGGVLFTTKGDANPSADPWHFQLTDSRQPVVRFAVPHAGWVFIALAHQQVRMLVIGGPAALVALSALAELVGALRGGPRRPGAAPGSGAGRPGGNALHPEPARADGAVPAARLELAPLVAGNLDLEQETPADGARRVPPQRLPDAPTPTPVT